MLMNGFLRFKGLSDMVYPVPVYEEKKKDVVSPAEKLMDEIFSVNPLTGFPMSSISMYLSDKTRDEIRSYIERNILVDTSSNGISVPDELRSDYFKLDSEFIAAVSPNYGETVESYESRIQSYFDRIEESKRANSNLRKFANKHKDE